MFKGLRFFLREGWKYDKKYVLWLVMYQLVNSMIPVVGALLPKLVIDELTSAQRVERLVLYVGIFAGYLLLANALSSFFFWDGFTHRTNVAAEFDLWMHERLVQADFGMLESPAFHDMQAKAKKFLTCDYHGFGYLLDCAMRILGQMFTLVGLVAILLTLNVWFVLLFAILAVVCSVVESCATKASMKLRMDIAATERAWMYCAGLFEKLQWAKEIRLNGIGKWLLEKEWRYTYADNDSYRRSNNHYIRSGVVRAGLTFLQQCAAYAFLIAKVLSGGMGVGSFTMCIGAVTSFADALRQIMDSFTEIRAFDMYYDKLDEYLNIPQTLREGKRLPVEKRRHEIRFEDVSFRYPGAEVWALRNVSLVLKEGERLSLVGENGSGKTTLIKLLCRLYDPTEGRILMDGTDIRDLDYDQYLAQFSTVFQDLQLFDFSLRDNLALGREIGDPKLLEALEKVGLKQRVETLPKGLDTFVGRTFDEQGFEPSGGEAQKIALARALCKDAPVVVLDEPTAAMDPRAEYELYRSFDSLVGGKTVVYISHRLSSSRFCDRIAVLKGGRLVECGTHAELIALNGHYAGLYALQAQYYTD